MLHGSRVFSHKYKQYLMLVMFWSCSNFSSPISCSSCAQSSLLGTYSSSSFLDYFPSKCALFRNIHLLTRRCEEYFCFTSGCTSSDESCFSLLAPSTGLPRRLNILPFKGDFSVCSPALFLVPPLPPSSKEASCMLGCTQT